MSARSSRLAAECGCATTHSAGPLQGSEHVLCLVQVSPMGIAGYSLALASACWYNYGKLQAMKARQAPDAQDHSGNSAPIEQKPAGCQPKAGLSV